jgi:hypothetical protein
MIALRQALTTWIATLSAAAPAAPDDQAVAPQDLIKTAEASKKFTPVTAQDVARAKAQLAAAVRELDALLVRSGRQVETGWKRYLLWDELTQVLESNDPPPEDTVKALNAKFTADKNGLEKPQFIHVREALENYAEIAAAAKNPQLEQEFNEQYDALIRHLQAYQKDPASGDDALALGTAMGWMGTNRQADTVLASIRSQYLMPNLYGYASQRFAASGLEEYVDQTTAVNDNILGTSLFGTARLTGRTTLVIHDNPSVASMAILLRGTAISSNVGYNGPVTIHSSAVTGVSGQKPLQMTANGLYGFPATASARTNSTIHDLCARCGLIERVAWKRAGEQKGQSEVVGSQHAAARVAGQMNLQSGELIAEQNEKYYDKFRNPLVRRGEFPRDLTFSSRSDQLQVRMLHAAGDEIAAPAPPPEYSESHDLAVRAHESVVTNFGETMLGGIEMTDVRLEKLLRDDLKAEVPDELRVTLPNGELDPDKEPWSITFARQLPVRAKFNGGGLWLAIRADGFARGEGETPGSYRPAIRELMEISAAYKIDKTPAGATLRRDGDVRVRFPNRENPEQILARDNVTVSFMRRKFRNLFKEEFVGEGLVFKDRWAKAGRLRLGELKSDAAWLTLGWNMSNEQAAAEPPAAE